MARSDLLLSLVKAGTSGNEPLFQKTVEAMIADERGKRHKILADQLAELLTRATITRSMNEVKKNSVSTSSDLFYEINPKKKLSDIILSEKLEKACRALIEEQHRVDILRSYNLEPRHRILLIGPPGNGKTTLAEALAFELMIPLISVRYEGLIGSYLGETASRLKKIFDYVKTRSCVLFFDEFDTLGKERGDTHETGEIKRVVSSLLMQIDQLPSHVVVVTATNHPELLDRAVWRRFQLKVEMPAPSKIEIERYFNHIKKEISIPFPVATSALAEGLLGKNFSELKDFVEDVARKYVLSLPGGNIKSIINEFLPIKKKKMAAQPKLKKKTGKKLRSNK